MYFEQLPVVYKRAINDAIHIVQGAEDPEVAECFKEWEAEALLGCELSDNDKVDDDFEGELVGFKAGWNAFFKYYIIPAMQSN